MVLLIQRSHDMDLSGWWSLAAFIPFVGLVWVFKGGTRGANRWGAPPPPNGRRRAASPGWHCRSCSWSAWSAAIALPAYQQYSIRANAGAPR